jgi:GntR family transcriptional repressor for pyruvate dehydrogenase complex
VKIAANQLSDMILTEGMYAPNQKLPNETELAEMLGVGRTTIREAIKTLAARGVIAIQRGNGTFVAENPGVVPDPFGFGTVEGKVEFLQEWYATREAYESGIMDLVISNTTDEDIQELHRVLAEQTKIMEDETTMRQYVLEFIKLDQAFHKAIAIATHNSVIQRVQPVVLQVGYFELIGSFGHIMYPHFAENVRIYHNKILDCIEKRDAEGAAIAMKMHMQYSAEGVKLYNLS